jgi:hypothetical protein
MGITADASAQSRETCRQRCGYVAHPESPNEGKASQTPTVNACYRKVIAQADVRSAGPAGKGKPFKVRRMASRAPIAFRRPVSITDLMSA